MVGIMLRCMDGFLLSVLEGRELGYFFGYFDGTEDVVGGPCEGLRVGGIMTDSEIDAMQLNGYSPVSCREEM